MSQFPSQKAKLTESNSILAALQEIATRIGFLSAVRGIAADLRVTLLSGVLTSVGTVTTVTTVSTVTSTTTVGTLTNQTNIGGHNAALTVLSQVNNLAVVGNINNIY